MKAKAVRSLAQGIGGMTAAGVATATFIGDGDATAAKKAGCAASKLVKRIIKRRMLNLDSFNYNTITESSASPDCENASDTADDSGDDLAEDTDDDGADDDIDSENDMTDDD
ncbi:hypothetical protein OIU84_001338 [Salix udensis]|uniref:Uncharacterized protein n=1 Tax=Salix udensis TaxID=889485 RepID=A0AAD6K6W6_9ROSI|nr:hypothetical protein OIU84_001338 [Salix udensis]